MFVARCIESLIYASKIPNSSYKEGIIVSERMTQLVTKGMLTLLKTIFLRVRNWH
jgi:hypothetical protein